MQNERSGARSQRKEDEEVLSPGEERGQTLKRYVRAAAALNAIYDDTRLGKAAGVGRAAVRAWWTGARMSTDTIRELAEATGLSRDELTEFVHYAGPPPSLPDPAILPVRAGIQKAEARLADEGPGTPSPQPARRPRGSGAGHG